MRRPLAVFGCAYFAVLLVAVRLPAGLLYPIAATLLPVCALLVFAAARLWRRAPAGAGNTLWRCGKSGKAFAGLVLAALLLGAAGLGCLQTGLKDSLTIQPLAQLDGSTRPVRARVLDAQPGYGGDTVHAVLQVLAFADGGDTTSPAPQSFTVLARGLAEVQPGELVELPLRFSGFSSTASQISNYAKGYYIAASAAGPVTPAGQAHSLQTIMRTLQYAASDSIHARLPADLASIVAAMSVGDRRYLSAATTEAFRAAGISHILVVSGFHLSLLCIVLQRILRTFTKNRRLQSIVCIVFIAGFMGFTGLTPSVVRGGLAWVLLCLGQLLYRRADPPTSLALAAVVILLANPHACLDVGTQLSFAATLGALAAGQLGMRRAAKWTPDAALPRRALRRLGRACLTPLCTTLATLPVLVAAGMGVSLAFLPANLVVTLLAPVIILCGFFMAVPAGVAVLGWPGLPASLIGGMFTLWLQNLAAFFLNVPGVLLQLGGLFALAAVLCIYATAFAAYKLRRPVAGLLACTLLLGLAVGLHAALGRGTVRVYSTGGVNPSLVVCQDGQSIVLYRGRQTASAVRRILRQNGAGDCALFIDLRRTADSTEYLRLFSPRAVVVAEDDVTAQAVYPPFGDVTVSLARQGGGTVACVDVAGYKIGLTAGAVDLAPYARLDLLLAGSGAVAGDGYQTLVYGSAPPDWAAPDARLLESDGGASIWIRPGKSIIIRQTEVRDGIGNG